MLGIDFDQTGTIPNLFMAAKNLWLPEIHSYQNLTRSFMSTQHLFNKFIMYSIDGSTRKTCC
jgi:hypothetical protein